MTLMRYHANAMKSTLRVVQVQDYLNMHMCLKQNLKKKRKKIENYELTCWSAEALWFITQNQLSHVVKKISTSEEKEKEHMKEIKTKEELAQKQHEVVKEYQRMIRDYDELVKENDLL